MRTKKELERAAAEAEAMLDALDPDDTPAEDASDLRAIAEAVDDMHDAEERVRQAVHAARANGRSWGLISLQLGVSRQAAHERFNEKHAADL